MNYALRKFNLNLMNQNSEYTLVIRMNQLKNLSKTIMNLKGGKVQEKMNESLA